MHVLFSVSSDQHCVLKTERYLYKNDKHRTRHHKHVPEVKIRCFFTSQDLFVSIDDERHDTLALFHRHHSVKMLINQRILLLCRVELSWWLLLLLLLRNLLRLPLRRLLILDLLLLELLWWCLKLLWWRLVKLGWLLVLLRLLLVLRG